MFGTQRALLLCAGGGGGRDWCHDDQWCPAICYMEAHIVVAEHYVVFALAAVLVGRMEVVGEGFAYQL